MQKNESGKSKKNQWFQGVKSEFKKITWTDRKSLVKQTALVLVITILLGVLVSVMDAGILEGINLLL